MPRFASIPAGLCCTAIVATNPALGQETTEQTLVTPADRPACAELAEMAVQPDLTIESAEAKEADAQFGIGAYCEVLATSRPVERSNIGIVIRLPETWNGKILGLGGGGWAGNVWIERG